MTSKLLVVAITLSVLLVAGCTRSPVRPFRIQQSPRRLHGLTAKLRSMRLTRKGFFQGGRTGAELVKCNWSTYRMRWRLAATTSTSSGDLLSKADRAGLDVRFLAGIHRGCLRVQAGVKTNITDPGLKGKRIGVPGMGTPHSCLQIVSSASMGSMLGKT